MGIILAALLGSLTWDLIKGEDSKIPKRANAIVHIVLVIIGMIILAYE